MAHHNLRSLSIIYSRSTIDAFFAYKHTLMHAGILLSRNENKKVYIRIFAGYNIGV